ncbi:MAG: S8 family serine peptidase, partial [Hyphomicrobiales bacterium]|nr:S8 family serine peptidase [Hyphomicrobiales bacterium]
MTRKRLPTKEKRISLPVFPVVTGLAFCLLVGCGGGGGGSTTSTGAPEPDINCRPGGNQECQFVNLPDTPDTPDDLLPDAIDPEDPTNMPDMPGMPDRPEPPPSTLPTGLLNQDKLVLVKAPQAWFFNVQQGISYTGDGVVVGIMEEVNSFHLLFGPIPANSIPTKIHAASVLTSPYPTTADRPEDRFIVDEDDFEEYPDYPCLLQFGIDCYDSPSDAKYFLRKKDDGTLHVLPGLRDPSRRRGHQCPMFNLGEGPEPVCPEFGASHGTGVASAAAAYAVMFTVPGNPGSTSFRGIAYDAEILVYARPLEIAGLPASFTEHADYFRSAPPEADVYNFSHTFGTPVTGNEGTTFTSGSRAGFAAIANAIRDMGKPFIAAAGNEGEAFPRFPAALPLFWPDLRGQVLAVAATDDEGRITQYSNRCGTLPSDWVPSTHGRHYCLAAPGGIAPFNKPFWVAGPGSAEFTQTSGTSFAAPVVAGAFAILKERFRGSENLDDEQIIRRLVDTANNGGHYREVAIYGAGLLDIENAITPVGSEKVHMGGDIDGGITYDFDITSLSTSAAFGDALQRAFQTHEIATFDEL